MSCGITLSFLEHPEHINNNHENEVYPMRKEKEHSENLHLILIRD